MVPHKPSKSVVNEIGKEIWAVWNVAPNNFAVHPSGNGVPRTQAEFRKMFQAEINDANTASVVSGALGIPISRLSPGPVTLLGDDVTVNQSQIDRQQPNMR